MAHPKVTPHAAAALIGAAPDQVVAVLIGVTPSAVRPRRTGPPVDARAWLDNAAARAQVRAIAEAEAAANPARAPALDRVLSRWVPDWAPLTTPAEPTT